MSDNNDLLKRAKENMKAYKQAQKERERRLQKFAPKPEEKDDIGKRGTYRVVKSALE